MKVLVTGGAGYIGSHTCKLLHKFGHQPIVVDNLVYGHEWAVKWGPLYKVNIKNTEKLIQIFNEEKPEAVIHFAAFAYVGESVKQPEKYWDNNVKGSQSLLDAMLACDIKKIIFSSTCATYGVPKTLPITETNEQKPINPYGETKLEVERILKSLAESDNLEATALRYFNAAGADPDCEIGEDHDPETHLIPLAVEAALKNNRTLSVFGSDYNTVDGTCVRDYIHVNDLARAHILALEKLQPGFRAYNLGTGNGNSVKQVIDAVSQSCGIQVPFEMSERRPGDPPTLVADASLAKKELDWTPNMDLSTITDTAVSWYKKHFKVEQ